MSEHRATINCKRESTHLRKLREDAKPYFKRLLILEAVRGPVVISGDTK
jgi:hypothetical protein